MPKPSEEQTVAAEPDDNQADGERPSDDLFAALPRSRPGSRSELRDRSRNRPPRRPSPTQPAKVDPPVVAEADRAAVDPPAPSRTSPAPATSAEGADDPRGSVEGLAWAGVTAAAEAATLGVKLATRAMSAVRGAVERK
ncbi:hypothetical protein HJD18_04615 [Thermoleophilia bacterium SCSIO 60948]|nr:hypothetical protein HJD18_04615 [Thermoleophilia bacterium SCSIO 60948]